MAAYDLELNPIRGFPRRIGAVERKPADQFWPTSAVDERSGRLVLCFYASGTGAARARATFSCAVSDALAVSDGVAHPVWTDTRLGRTPLAEEIFMTRLSR